MRRRVFTNFLHNFIERTTVNRVAGATNDDDDLEVTSDDSQDVDEGFADRRNDVTNSKSSENEPEEENNVAHASPPKGVTFWIDQP